MTPYRPEVRQRDDGMYDVISGDISAGPFPTIAFAAMVAEGRVPEPRPAPKFRRFMVIREVILEASA